MGYRIEYDSSVHKYEIRPVHSGFFPLLWVAAILILGMLLYAGGAFTSLQAFLIPGEDLTTVHAFQCMANDLRSGAGLYDAVYDFCSIVIHGS